MTFSCYASNIPFLVETCLTVLNAKLSIQQYCFQFHILMASLSPQSTLIAMQQSNFMKMFSSIPDWQKRLTDKGFAFLNEILFDLLGISSLSHDAYEAYFTLVSRVDVVRPLQKTRCHLMAPWIRKKPTFTLSPQVDDGDRIALPPKEALAMTSPGFVAYIKEHWGTVVYPVVGHEKDPNLCITKLWDEYHTSCFPLPKPRGK